ncbi:platelet glycoprotein VI isoform X2 [Tupaia chinensis]|uniref:platelet glycoprotein VI isoform X2 n=1 Tax=Tupaia chinensis TaxID=246437 RepID=UPI000FFB3F99|nr:platelet glycoprotein VI isoform X2 [Tupaia chinensis]
MALPSFLVPLWEPVTVRCQGPPGVDSYRLERLRPTEYKDQATLVIPAMKAEFAGRYRCFYQMGAGWSPASEQLELVATGAFDKPSLSARPSTEVSPGGRVTLQCRATYGFDRFALYKEGDPRTSQRPGKWYEADFSLGAVTPAVGGTYRCYSFSSKSPYLWSAPSDPLELTVTAPQDTWPSGAGMTEEKGSFQSYTGPRSSSLLAASTSPTAHLGHGSQDTCWTSIAF